MYDRQYYFLVRHNEEKVIYFLLLGRKERQPSTEDDTQAISSHRHNGNTHSLLSSAPSSSPSTWYVSDPPRKRVDSATAPSTSSLYLNTRGRSHSIGSAGEQQTDTHTHLHETCCKNLNVCVGLDSTSSTRQTRVNSVATPTYNPSAAGYYTYSSPSSRTRKTSYALGDTASLTLPVCHILLLVWLHLNPLPPFTAWCFATATGVTVETKVVSDNEDLHGVATVSPPTPGRSSRVADGNQHPHPYL